MKPASLILAAALPALLLAGCASAPTGPTVMALPGTGKNFEQFRRDDEECRQYAEYQIGGAVDSANNSQLRSAAVGTAVGAVAGAAIGGHQGAGTGAGTGLIVGTMAGAGAAQGSGYDVQRRYDYAYIQCMYSKGEQVPVPAGQLHSRPAAPAAAPAAPSYPPPPPPDYTPPPPR
jgi:outer membrane lipoprotein SlyB